MRGAHALNSFAALGSLAHALIDGQRRGHVYVPLERLAELGGSVLLLGVGLTSTTLLHLAESLAGRRRFVRWANDSTGHPAAWDVGGCSDGFDRFELLLAPLARELVVGNSRWRAFPAQETAGRGRRDAGQSSHHPLLRPELPALPGCDSWGSC